MKAVRLLEYGGQLVFNDVPTPAIARDEILVKIKSTAVNHLDLVEASGTARQILPIDLPWIPGHEFSGVVEQIGSDLATFAPGDAVFGTTGGSRVVGISDNCLVVVAHFRIQFIDIISIDIDISDDDYNDRDSDFYGQAKGGSGDVPTPGWSC